MFESPPTYNDPKSTFTTDFEHARGAGFFPVHSGRLVATGSSPQAPVRMVVFGTDWGLKSDADQCYGKAMEGCECDCQRSLRPKGQPRPCPTERNLFDALTEVQGLDLKTVVLTNAVLALSTGVNRTGNERVFRRHPEHLRDCGAYHRKWLDRQKPSLAVLMGAAHLTPYGSSVWSVVWPELFGPGGAWCGLELGDAFLLGRTVATAASGLRVQLVYHPSSGQYWRKHRHDVVETWKREMSGGG